MKNLKILKAATLLAYATMVAVNYLAVLLPLGGRSTGQISDNYQNLFAPAGYAFSIWGLIYILLGIYSVYQLRRKNDELVEKVDRFFIANAFLNASWIFAWHYNIIWLSVIIMIALLITLIKIADIFSQHTITPKETLIVRLPFSIYFGWITVATIANITVFLVSIGWNGFGFSDSFWTLVVLSVGALIGSWRMFHDRFIPYGLVLIWAYSAILYKHLSGSGFAGKYPHIIWTAAFCLLVFVGTIIFITIKRKNK